MTVFGYCRISKSSQKIDRQIRNIEKEYPEAIIIQEAFTGTKIEGRAELKKLIGSWEKVDGKDTLVGGVVKENDIIVFDSVSRMSRSADSGFKLYEELYRKGVELVFLKEPHINTSTYKEALSKNIEMTGTNLDFLLEGINKYLMALAKDQIKIAFEQAEKEVKDLQQRTREGLITAKLNGKRVGTEKGRKLVTKKSVEAKEQIKKYSRDFQGTLNDKEVIQLIGIARNSYYKYKKELIQELSE